MSTGFGRCIERNLRLLQPPLREAQSVTKGLACWVVTRFVAEVTRFGAAVVQRLRTRTCAACVRAQSVSAFLGESGSAIVAARDKGRALVAAACIDLQNRSRTTVRGPHPDRLSPPIDCIFRREGSDADRDFNTGAAGPERRVPWAGPRASRAGNCHGRS